MTVASSPTSSRPMPGYSPPIGRPGGAVTRAGLTFRTSGLSRNSDRSRSARRTWASIDASPDLRARRSERSLVSLAMTAARTSGEDSGRAARSIMASRTVRWATRRRADRRALLSGAAPQVAATRRERSTSRVRASLPEASVRRAAFCGSVSGSTIRPASERAAVKAENASPASDGNCSWLRRVPEGGAARASRILSGMSRFPGSSAAIRRSSASFCFVGRHPRDGLLPVSRESVRLILAAHELLGGLDAEPVVQVGEREALLQVVNPLARLQLTRAEALENAPGARPASSRASSPGPRPSRTRPSAGRRLSDTRSPSRTRRERSSRAPSGRCPVE